MSGIYNSSGLWKPSSSAVATSSSGSQIALHERLAGGYSVPVMSSPPTVTLTTGATTITSPLLWTNTSGAMSYHPTTTVNSSGFRQVGFSSSLMMIIEFYCDDDLLDCRFQNTNCSIVLEIDGVAVDATGYATNSDGSTSSLLIDWSGSKKIRRYTIRAQNASFGGIYTRASGQVWAPQPQPGPLIAVFGDSYVNGTGALKAGWAWCYHFGRFIRARVWGEGIGSTGWLSTSASLPATRVTNRMAQLDTAPDYVLSALGYNDAGGNMTTLAANYAAWAAAVLGLWPKTQIVTLGPWTPIGPTANLTLVKNALVTATAAAGGTFLDFDGVITVANKTRFTAVDNVHPLDTPAHVYVGARVATLWEAAGLL